MPDTSLPAVVGTTARLRGALDAAGDALATADLEGLLEAEAGLADSFGRLAGVRPSDAGDLRALTVEIGRTRAALVRCRRLGNVLVDVARLAAQARGESGAYGREGQPRGSGRGASLEARA